MRIPLIAILSFAGAAGADNTAPSPSPAAICPTSELEASVAQGPKKVASVKAATATLERLTTGVDDACKVALFKIYWSFYGSVQMGLSEQVQGMEPGSAARTKVEREIKPLGWVVHDSEAGNYIADGSDWLVKRVGKRLPGPWRTYLSQLLADGRQSVEEDAGLKISVTELRQRIRRWDDFLTANPTFEKNEEIQRENRNYLAVLLFGLDNTPAFEDNTLRPEVKTEIEAYLADKHSRDTKLVRGYYNLLKAHGFQDRDRARKYLQKKGLIEKEE